MTDSNEASAGTAPKAEASTTTPIFGAASTFGTGTGFAGFTGVDVSKSPQKEEEEDAAPEEESTAEFKPVVQLDEVEVTTGEELEEQLFEAKCKLYRFDNDAGEWKERGVGQVRFLENKENKRIRLLMRQEKTLKIRANHLVLPGTKLQEHSGSEKAWVWSTVDFSDEEQKVELFCMRFASVERAQEFKKHFDESVEKNDKLLTDVLETADTSKEGDEEAEALADKVGEVSVSDEKADGEEVNGA